MEIELGQSFPVDWRGVPPHMSIGDFPIWERYLLLNRTKYDRFYYDVAFLPDVAFPPNTPEDMKKMWRRVSAKRADVVAVRGGNVEIIEVRVQASSGALGAILQYIHLWQKLLPLPYPFKGVVISDLADDALKSLAGTYGITVIEA